MGNAVGGYSGPPPRRPPPAARYLIRSAGLINAGFERSTAAAWASSGTDTPPPDTRPAAPVIGVLRTPADVERGTASCRNGDTSSMIQNARPIVEMEAIAGDEVSCTVSC